MFITEYVHNQLQNAHMILDKKNAPNNAGKCVQDNAPQTGNAKKDIALFIVGLPF